MTPKNAVVVVTGTVEGVEWAVCEAPTWAGAALNGYCRVPDQHHDWPELIDVHGGITYETTAWIGFDTLHSGDQWPGNHLFRYEDDPWVVHWDQARVVAETKRMAQQVADITNYTEYHDYVQAKNHDQ